VADSVAQSNAIRSLGRLPLVVLGSNRPPLDAQLLRAQDAEAGLSTDSIDAIARHSTHYMQRPAPAGQPQVVVTAVLAVVDSVRAHKALPVCSRLFPTRSVMCR